MMIIHTFIKVSVLIICAYTPVDCVTLVTVTVQIQHTQQTMLNLSPKQAVRYFQQKYLQQKMCKCIFQQ